MIMYIILIHCISYRFGQICPLSHSAKLFQPVTIYIPCKHPRLIGSQSRYKVALQSISSLPPCQHSALPYLENEQRLWGGRDRHSQLRMAAQCRNPSIIFVLSLHLEHSAPTDCVGWSCFSSPFLLLLEAGLIQECSVRFSCGCREGVCNDMSVLLCQYMCLCQ